MPVLTTVREVLEAAVPDYMRAGEDEIAWNCFINKVITNGGLLASFGVIVKDCDVVTAWGWFLAGYEGE